MNARRRSDLVNVICDIDNLLRGRYKRNEHSGVIVPFTVLRRLNCVLDAADGDPQAAGGLVPALMMRARKARRSATPTGSGGASIPGRGGKDAGAPTPAHHARSGRER